MMYCFPPNFKYFLRKDKEPLWWLISRGEAFDAKQF